MSSVLELSPTDGRWMRSVRTRSAIIESWLELIQEGDLSPTAKGVADRAGIGLRTIFQHFSDMNALHTAAGHELAARVLSRTVHVSTELPFEERLDQSLASRSDMWEALTLLRRSFERQEWVSSEIRVLIGEWEASSLAATVRNLSPELDAIAEPRRQLVVMAVDAVLCWANWNQLRDRRGLDADEARAVMSCAVYALLG